MPNTRKKCPTLTQRCSFNVASTAWGAASARSWTPVGTKPWAPERENLSETMEDYSNRL